MSFLNDFSFISLPHKFRPSLAQYENSKFASRKMYARPAPRATCLSPPVNLSEISYVARFSCAVLFGRLPAETLQEWIFEFLRCEPIAFLFACHPFDPNRKFGANQAHHLNGIEFFLFHFLKLFAESGSRGSSSHDGDSRNCSHESDADLRCV